MAPKLNIFSTKNGYRLTYCYYVLELNESSDDFIMELLLSRKMYAHLALRTIVKKKLTWALIGSWLPLETIDQSRLSVAPFLGSYNKDPRNLCSTES